MPKVELLQLELWQAPTRAEMADLLKRFIEDTPEARICQSKVFRRLEMLLQEGSTSRAYYRLRAFKSSEDRPDLIITIHLGPQDAPTFSRVVTAILRNIQSLTRTEGSFESNLMPNSPYQQLSDKIYSFLHPFRH
jgi:hypothetical protein